MPTPRVSVVIRCCNEEEHCGRLLSGTRGYVRPMTGWWLRTPRFRRYMLREASALFLVAYALVLLVGLLRLAQGEAAFALWRAALGHPLAIAGR